MPASTFLTWISIVLAAGFGIATIYYGRKAVKSEVAREQLEKVKNELQKSKDELEKSRKKLDWTDLQSCANDMGLRLKKEFVPELIFTPSLRGATFANLIVNEFDKNIPVIVGISSWKEDDDVLEQLPNHETIKTTKWFVHVPGLITDFKDKKVLVVDDFVISGDFLLSIKKLLLRLGFQEDNIRTLSIVTTKVAEETFKAPDYYWYPINDTNFYFPWGKAK